MINRRSVLLFLPLGLALAEGRKAHAGVTGSGGGGNPGASGGRGGGNPGGGGGGNAGGDNSGGGGSGSGGGNSGGGSSASNALITPRNVPDDGGSLGTGTETASLARGAAEAPRGLASDSDRILAAVERGDAMPLSDIVAAVRKRYQGKILRIRLRGRPDALQYRIRVLSPDKRLIDIKVNARTAQIIADTEG